MGLIVTPRHTQRDLDHWRRVAEPTDDATQARLGTRLSTKVRWAREELLRFVQAPGGGYLGVSWGKDSVVCAWLVHQLEREEGVTWPVVWVRVGAWQNPDSHLVRDAFLARWPLREYVEIDAVMGASVTGAKEERLVGGFREAAKRYGDRYVSGVRADESHTRRISIARLGLSTDRVCRPIGRWTAAEVFGLACREDLPLHPAYGYTLGGLLDRARIRVANIGGVRGAGHGREEWERVYYPDVWSAAERAGTER